MIEVTRYRKPVKGLITFATVGLLLGHDMSLYQFEETLICWLFFSVAFVSLALVILAGLLVSYAGEWVIHWVTTAPRVMSPVALRPFEIYSGMIPAEDPSEPAKEFSNLDP